MYKVEQSIFFSTLNFYSLMCNEQLVAARLQVIFYKHLHSWKELPSN